MTTVFSRPVFHAHPGPPTLSPSEWAPLTTTFEDDELVYPVARRDKKSVRPDLPALRLSTVLPGKKSLRFECFICGILCVVLVDSGATHSFFQVAFVDRSA